MNLFCSHMPQGNLQFGHVYFVHLSYDVVSYRQYGYTCYNTLAHRRDVTDSVSTMRFFIERMSVFKAIESNFKGSYDKQNLTLEVISYEVYMYVIR